MDPGSIRAPGIPERAPGWDSIFRSSEDVQISVEKMMRIFHGARMTVGDRYVHWATLKHRKDAPAGLTNLEWWASIKFARKSGRRPLPLSDSKGRPFSYCYPDSLHRMLSEFDRKFSGQVEVPAEVSSKSERDRYRTSMMIREAITSSQLEGAATTRRVAREMIRSGRAPRGRDEQMIFNNHRAMLWVRENHGQDLTPDRLCELHSILTVGTLDHEGACGRFRTVEDGRIAVFLQNDEVAHVPPPPDEIALQIQALCDFANERGGADYIHPAVRAIVLHFWMGFVHPFVDGNGRTARALFYWSTLRSGYWLSEYISISHELKQRHGRYTRSFLYSEDDENDLTYFLLFNLEIVLLAITDLHRYIQRKIAAMEETRQLMRRAEVLNHRQIALLTHALRNPDFRYTFESHRASHEVVYQTARSDILGLVERGLLEARRMGRKHVFVPSPEIESNLNRLRG
jgi:Fic family protein